MQVNLWLALSEQAITAFKAYDPDSDNNVMDEFTYKALSKAHDHAVVQQMFKPVTTTRTYRNFSLYFEGTAKAKEAIDTITELWPVHIIVIGAWWFDSGLQAGTERDENGDITGTPIYPVHAQAWRLMPDQYTYNENGDVLTTISASSNADLRDVNLLAGQAPRVF